MKNAKIIIPAIAVGAILLGGSLYSTRALASTPDDRRSEMAKSLANKLGVDEAKVTAAMDEIHTERQQKRQEEVSAKLDKAVSDGVITVEQKQKILDKMAEAKEARSQKREEMRQWFKDNGIDSDKIHEYIGFGFGKGDRESRGPRSN